MNVHINYDLAVASEQLCPDEKLLPLCADFIKINEILASALTQIESELFKLSPVIALLSRMVYKVENQFLNFSMGVARSESWSFACLLANTDAEQKEKLLLQYSQSTQCLSGQIIYPGFFANLLLRFAGLFEFGSIKKTIATLGQKGK
jgi:hypothetical protein